MSSIILGKKIGSTQIFDETGNRVPVTVVEAGPCVVVQKLSETKHRYTGIQIGFEEVAGRKKNKPCRGLFERLGMAPMRYLKEVRMTVQEADAYKVGDKITVSLFKAGEKIDVIGTSKGRGFQGVVKKYHFAGHTMTRGTHEYRRHPGSIGMRERPGHVLKGKKLPGHMGDVRVTTQNLVLVKVDEEQNLLLIRGAVPGHRGALVMIRKAIKRAKPKAPPQKTQPKGSKAIK